MVSTQQLQERLVSSITAGERLLRLERREHLVEVDARAALDLHEHVLLEQRRAHVQDSVAEHLHVEPGLELHVEREHDAREAVPQLLPRQHLPDARVRPCRTPPHSQRGLPVGGRESRLPKEKDASTALFVFVSGPRPWGCHRSGRKFCVHASAGQRMYGHSPWDHTGAHHGLRIEVIRASLLGVRRERHDRALGDVAPVDLRAAGACDAREEVGRAQAEDLVDRTVEERERRERGGREVSKRVGEGRVELGAEFDVVVRLGDEEVAAERHCDGGVVGACIEPGQGGRKGTGSARGVPPRMPITASRSMSGRLTPPSICEAWVSIGGCTK